MENRMYVNAIRVYQKLIEKKDAAAISDEMRERIFHNQGCATAICSRWTRHWTVSGMRGR